MREVRKGAKNQTSLCQNTIKNSHQKAWGFGGEVVKTRPVESLPILRNPTPGFFRYALGIQVVTALCDGYVILDPMSLFGITDEECKSDLTKQLLRTSGALDTSVYAFFVL